MCGIAGFHIKDPKYVKKHAGVELMVNKLLLGIENRGRHATGFVATTFDGRVVTDKADKTAALFIKDREIIPANVQTVLLHTRHWTKGPPENHLNNHPVMSGTCFAVHNGQVSNDDALFAQYKLKRQAEVDSEIIPALANHVGLDDVPEFMKQFEGSVATALIDPINFPGRCVLARAKSSPLIAHENGHVVVFASTITAIKEAWAAVFGTPPDNNKFNTFDEGEVWVFDKGIKTTEKFTPKMRVYVNNNWQKAREEREAKERQRAVAKAMLGTSESRFVKPTDEERVTAVRQWVAEARDKNDERMTVCYLPMTSDQKDEMLEKYPEMGNIMVWKPCHCCNETVEKNFIVKTASWGEICKDCHIGCVQFFKVRYQVGTTAEDDAMSDAMSWFDTNMANKLDRFVQAEAAIHADALVAVHDDTGIPTEIVEFLIFRMPDAYEAKHPYMADIRMHLDEMYQEFVEALWDEGEATDKDVIELRGLEEEDENLNGEACGTTIIGGTERAYCSEHGSYYLKTAHCDGCILDESWKDYLPTGLKVVPTSLPTVGGLSAVAKTSTVMTKCDCGRLIYGKEDGHCFVCKNNMQRAGVKPITPLGDQKATTGASDSTVPPVTCCRCNSKTEFYIPNHTTGRGWCVHHFIGCEAASEGPGNKCDKLSNHTRPDGARVCHAHARNEAGVRSDTQLEATFGPFVEIRS